MQETATFIPRYENLQLYKVHYVVSALLAIWMLRKLFATSSKQRLPPAPPALPVLGHLHLLGTHPHVAFAKLAQKYGPLMSLRLGQRQCIVASSPETAREFLKHQDANFCSRPGHSSAGTIIAYNGQAIGFQQYTAKLRYLRKIFIVDFLNLRQVRVNQQAREAEAAFMLNSIYQKCSSQEEIIEVKAHLNVMMLNTISYMALKKRFAGNLHQTEEMQEKAKDFLSIVEEVFQLTGIFVPGDFIPSLKWLDLQGCVARMKKLAKRLDAFTSDIVLEHRERRKRGPVQEHEKDLVHFMLEKQAEMDGHYISDDNIKALLLDTFVAGTETTLVTVEWLITELVRNPTVMAKAQAELDHVVGRDRLVQESDLQNLPYLHAVLKETFRLHPPGPLLVPHESINAAKAFGYDIPAKTRLFVNVWAMGRDPALWKEPLVFNPERFLQENLAQMDVRGLDFELLPFGAGRRMCPAMPMAVTVTQFTAASLLHAFQWSLPDQMDPKDLDMTEAFGLSLPKAIPLQAVVKPRLEQRLYQYQGSDNVDQ